MRRTPYRQDARAYRIIITLSAKWTPGATSQPSVAPAPRSPDHSSRPLGTTSPSSATASPAPPGLRVLPQRHRPGTALCPPPSAQHAMVADSIRYGPAPPRAVPATPVAPSSGYGSATPVAPSSGYGSPPPRPPVPEAPGSRATDPGASAVAEPHRVSRYRSQRVGARHHRSPPRRTWANSGEPAPARQPTSRPSVAPCRPGVVSRNQLCRLHLRVPSRPSARGRPCPQGQLSSSPGAVTEPLPHGGPPRSAGPGEHVWP